MAKTGFWLCGAKGKLAGASLQKGANGEINPIGMDLFVVNEYQISRDPHIRARMTAVKRVSRKTTMGT